MDRDRLGVFGLSLGVPAARPRGGRATPESGRAQRLWVVFPTRASCPKPICSISCPASGSPLSWGAADPISSFPSKPRMRPMFRLLGAPEKDKRLFLWDGGHGPPDLN